MKLQTKYLGEVEIDSEKIIEFPSGIPGFLDEKQFVLLDFPDNPVFQILQSVSSVNISFIVTNPYLIYPNYSFELDDNILETLEISSEKEVAVLSIVTLKDPFSSSTLNLKAPIIINSNHMLGKQFIINKEDYPSKALMYPEPSMKGVK
ncbi:flagellar assembly protein FliW [Oceanobacillus halophilus]|uniref:Flagellar assembly factor FliW n=1 Tax=Oceanobacillus halophilus TaxID=930130 RepID=A0A495A860_9BACI|nr:flagellar assembly protein FliW [Oceanobacillus halophilus]RKQ35575.1 flagellar assembly protein FliW [Oceanobacillus halophilus]